MNETMKKKPRVRKPSGGAAKHPADLHGPSDADVDALAAKIARMPRREVRAKLRKYGIEPDAAVERIKARLEDTLRRDHHGISHDEASTPILRLDRGLTTAVGRTPSFGWRSTRCIADRLSGAASREGERAAIVDGFEHLGVEADALRNHCAADPDAAWPLIEAVHEAAIAVSHCPDLWMPLAIAQARLASRLSPMHQCLLVHNAHELHEDGIVPAGLIVLISDSLEQANLATAARAMLAPGFRRHTARVDRCGGDAVALLTKPHPDPLSCFVAMEALGHAAASDESALREVEGLAHCLRDHSLAHFFAIGALSRFRRRHPNRAAATMAAAAESANEHARYGLFVAAIRGYEHSFGGRRQPIVPHFDLARAPQFVPGRPHDLDLFGELVCRSNVARELHAQMQWANGRFAMWRSMK